MRIRSSPRAKFTCLPVSSGIAVEDLGQQIGTPRVTSRTFTMPIAVCRHPGVINRPRIEWVVSQSGDQFAGIHSHVTSSRWHRPCLVTQTSHQVPRIIATHAVYNLSDLVEAQSPRTAGVIETAQRTGKYRFTGQIQAVGVFWRPHFIVIEGRRFLFLEPRLDPVDSAGVAVKADSHWERYAQEYMRRDTR